MPYSCGAITLVALMDHGQVQLAYPAMTLFVKCLLDSILSAAQHKLMISE
jgi:hypothetical protein